MAKTPTTAEATPPEGVTDAATLSGQDATTVVPGADQAEAAAAAEAEAKAKADAEAAEAEAKAKADAEAEPAPGPNLRVLNHLTKQVEMLNHYGLRQGLVDEMRDHYGATIVEDEVEGVTISIEGVTIDPSDSLENALTNWANAARRAVLEATA